METIKADAKSYMAKGGRPVQDQITMERALLTSIDDEGKQRLSLCRDEYEMKDKDGNLVNVGTLV